MKHGKVNDRTHKEIGLLLLYSNSKGDVFFKRSRKKVEAEKCNNNNKKH